MKRAFSYSRFSNQSQADGFSLVRQVERAKAFCERMGWTLDDRQLCDRGLSGYSGQNARRGDLAEFLRLVEDGRVPKGSVLIVENVDRLSRLQPDEATALVMKVVNAGVDVATLSPEAIYTKKTIHQVGVWVPLQVAISLAHEESRKKSERVCDAWARKRQALAKGKKSKRPKLTSNAPFWLRLTKDRTAWLVLEDQAELMRSILRWCADGLGCGQICRRLNKSHPAGLNGKGWGTATVRKVLRSRACLGEFQPKVGTAGKKGVRATSTPAGDPIADYYPRIADDKLWHRAQTALDHRRRNGKGGCSDTANLFSGILVNASDGERMVVNRANGRRVLMSAGGIRGLPGSNFLSVPVDIFESAMFGLLKELKASDVTRSDAAGLKADEAVKVWTDRLTAINTRKRQTEERSKKSDDPSMYYDLLDDLGRERKAAIAGLEKAERDAASPAAGALGECASLVDLLARAKGDERTDLRRRVKAALGRLVHQILVLIVKRGELKFVAVQVHFAQGDRYRDFFIEITRGRANRAANVDAFTCRGARPAIDLRDPKGVAKLSAALNAASPLTKGKESADPAVRRWATALLGGEATYGPLTLWVTEELDADVIAKIKAGKSVKPTSDGWDDPGRGEPPAADAGPLPGRGRKAVRR